MNEPGLQLQINVKVINHSQTQSCPERRENTSYKAVCLKYQSFKVPRIVMDSQSVEFDAQHWRELIFTGYLQEVSILPVEGWSVLSKSGKGLRARRELYCDCFLSRGSRCFSLHVWHYYKAHDFPLLMAMAGAYSLREESFITAVKRRRI